jgi:hypothetical protein
MFELTRDENRGSWMFKTSLLLSLIFALTACQKTDPPESVTQYRPVDMPGAEKQIISERVVATADGGTAHVVTIRKAPPPTDDIAILIRDCKAGDHARCTALGLAHQSAGKNAEAEDAWRRACDADHGPACFQLGNMLSNPFLKLGREKESIPLLEKACKVGVAGACYFLGGYHEEGKLGLKVDPKVARSFYEKGCEGGHYWACDKVGKKLKLGKRPKLGKKPKP